MPRGSFSLNRNNSGVGAIALALSAFSSHYFDLGKSINYEPDCIIRMLKLPITKLLAHEQTAETIESYLRRAIEETNLGAYVRLSVQNLGKFARYIYYPIASLKKKFGCSKYYRRKNSTDIFSANILVWLLPE